MTSSFRTPEGGRIDRATPVEFTFDGQTYTGHPGDTLASALLAAGRHQIATSIKLGRPRGIAAAWAEDPGGLEAHHQLERRRLFDREVARERAAQNPVHVDSGPAELLGDVRAV